MNLPVDITQLLVGDMRIDLRRGNIAMTQKFLDSS